MTTSTLDKETKTDITLRPYQMEAINDFLSGVQRGITRSIINLPTGTGKTVTGAALAKRVGGRVCWIAHRRELITQPAKAFAHVWPEATRGMVMDKHHEPDTDVVFVSVQSAISTRRRADLKNFDLVVVDESHHAAAPSYVNLLHHLGCFERDGPPLLGLTATVERADGTGLDAIFQGIAYQLPLLQAIEDSYLVDIIPRTVKLNVDLSVIRTGRDGDFNEDDLSDALMEAGVADAVAQAIVTHASDRRSIVFTASVEQAKLTSEALNRRGIKSRWVSGTTPPKEREAIIAALESSDVQAVCNCQVLGEGTDIPPVDCVVMARPTRSKTLYLQALGRGLRRYPGKSDCLVLDVVGATLTHSLIQAPLLFGLHPEKAEGKAVTDALKEPSNRSSPAERIINASQSAKAFKTALRWLKSSDDLFVLSAGTAGTVLMLGMPDGWHVRVTRKDEETLHLTTKAVSMQLAQGLAEDYIRRANVTVLIDPRAQWRTSPASEKILSALDKWHIPYSPAITSGEASDMLTLAIAQSQARRFRQGKEL